MVTSPKARAKSANQRFSNGKNAKFSASGKYRRRGPRNRFATQASSEGEVDRIIELMTAGMPVADIAEAMKLSVATLYRRIESIGKLMAGLPVTERKIQERRAVALLALLQANTIRAHAVAQKRMEKLRANACCPACQKSGLELEAFRLAAKIQKVEIDYLKHIGFFDWARSSGWAYKILTAAPNKSKTTPKSAANSGTCAVV